MARLTSIAVVFVIVCCELWLGQGDSRIPPEVLHKSGYANSVARPRDFSSVMLWGIVIADTRVSGHEIAQVEIARTQLSCRVDGEDGVLNDNRNQLYGGLYRRNPWFGTDEHEPMPLDLAGNATSQDRNQSGPVILAVGTRPDRVWHF